VGSKPEDALVPVPEGDESELVRRNFTFALDIAPAEVLDQLRNHPQIAFTDGAPDPFPDLSGPAFQAWPRDENAIYVRAAAGATETTLSPVVLIEISPRNMGSQVVGKFLKHPQRTRRYESLLKGAMWASAGFAALWLFFVVLMLVIEPIIGITYLFNVMTFVSPLALALPFTMRNTPSKESMKRYGQELWGLIGGIFVPHALGSDDQEDPFRERALGR
jgi:hypothetical protein